MRHQKATLKLNRTSSHRNAMFRNMVTSLFKYERIQTTDPKAKELRKWADNLITLAKRGDLHARRQALSIIREKDVVHKLFEDAAKRFGSINGGYTRVIKVGRRPGDAALMSMVELVSPGEETQKKPARKKEKADVAKETADMTDADASAEQVDAPAAADVAPTDADTEAPTDTEASAVSAETETETESVDETGVEEEKQPDSAVSEDKEDEEKTE